MPLGGASRRNLGVIGVTPYEAMLGELATAELDGRLR